MTKNAVLIVDDDQVFADTLARALERRGFVCRQCYSLESALQLMDGLVGECLADGGLDNTGHDIERATGDHLSTDNGWIPEKAVIDLKIGDDSGLKLVQYLSEKLPGCKSLVLTGYSSIATAVDAIKLGAVNYLPKPANADEILQAFVTDSLAAKAVSYTPASVDRLEWEHIQRVLRDHAGNISATARALNMHRRTLQRKLQKRPVNE
jgi:two-component system response regulator RegA